MKETKLMSLQKAWHGASYPFYNPDDMTVHVINLQKVPCLN